jgi:hypothetical protein
MGSVDFVYVAALGGAVGAGELFSRYRDRPGDALASLPAAIYVAVNIAASLCALLVIRDFHWTFGITSGPGAVRLVQILVGGFGAMALLRSSLFVVRVGGQDVGVGPGVLLTEVVGAADSMVSRRVIRRGLERRALLAKFALRDMSFDRVRVALPVYILALAGDVPPEDQASLANQIKVLSDSEDLDDHQKVLALGLALIDAFGEDLVVTALKMFGEEISAATEIPRARAAP